MSEEAEATQNMLVDCIPGQVMLEAVVGSTAHGTAVQDGLEDLDIIAVVIENASAFVGFHTKDTWTARTKPAGVRSEQGDVDYVAYGLRKYLTLALKGNPAALLPLFVSMQHLRFTTSEGLAMRDLASSIVSKKVYAPFRGYMRQQHERLLGLRGQRNVTRPELVDAYGYDTKYASHIVRLGIQGEELLLTGELTLPMATAERELVVSVRKGGYSLAEISKLIIEAEKQIDDAHARSPLPGQPDSKKVEKWMMEQYLAHWKQSNRFTKD